MGPKIAIILHMYYHDLWDEISTYLSNIDCDFDLYVSLCDNQDHLDIQNKIAEKYPHTIFAVLPNRGADIGPFFVMMNFIISQNIEYDYILKIHTKKSLRKEKKNKGYGKIWRTRCLFPLIGNKQNVTNCLKILNNKDVGIIGAKSQIIRNGERRKEIHNWVYEGKEYMDYFINIFELPNTSETFITGTMFWCKFWPLKKYLSKHTLTQVYFPLGDHGAGNTPAHAGERLFCKFFLAEQLKVIDV
jgi:lipopolysaccharide biosynthesis protein